MPRDLVDAGLPVASLADRLRLIAGVVALTLAKGPLLRRPRAERGAVRARRRGGPNHGAAEGPLRRKAPADPLPGRLHAVALGPEVALRILRGTPDPFSPATLEKRRALSHWEPETSLASRGEARAVRRTLALLAAHPVALAEAREEAQGGGRMMPLLRAAVLESIRLWPATPAILREAARVVYWVEGVILKGTSLVVFAPFLHRDPGRALPTGSRSSCGWTNGAAFGSRRRGRWRW